MVHTVGAYRCLPRIVSQRADLYPHAWSDTTKCMHFSVPVGSTFSLAVRHLLEFKMCGAARVWREHVNSKGAYPATEGGGAWAVPCRGAAT